VAATTNHYAFHRRVEGGSAVERPGPTSAGQLESAEIAVLAGWDRYVHLVGPAGFELSDSVGR